MYGLHEFDLYLTFASVSKSFRKAILACLPYQKLLMEKGRVSKEMLKLMEMDNLYKKRFGGKLDTVAAVL